MDSVPMALGKKPSATIARRIGVSAPCGAGWAVWIGNRSDVKHPG